MVSRSWKGIWVEVQGCIYVMPVSFGGRGPEPRWAPRSTGELPAIPSLCFPAVFHSWVLTSNLLLPWGCTVGWIWASGQLVSTGIKEQENRVGVCCVYDELVYLQGVRSWGMRLFLPKREPAFQQVLNEVRHLLAAFQLSAAFCSFHLYADHRTDGCALPLQGSLPGRLCHRGVFYFCTSQWDP